MPDIKRREMLKGMGLVSCVGTEAAFAATFAPASVRSLPHKVLANIVLAWQRAMRSSPIAFLYNNGLSLNSETKMIQMAIKNDFEQGSILDVNGLVLSQTETAYLCIYAEAKLATPILSRRV
jgi:DMSO/TMAO reductase YedYZ molybdopterin-dependent catalytic subunit